MTRRWLVNATRKAIDSAPDAADPAVRGTAETVTIPLSLVVPSIAGECGRPATSRRSLRPVAGGGPCPAGAGRRHRGGADPGQGQDRLEVSPEISEANLDGAALADEHPDRRSTGRGVHYVIVRAAKLVNMVV